MIVNNEDNGSVVSSGLVSEVAFKIELAGKAFRMLSDGLYTNKQGSIVRELSCNALDSHKAVGKADVPFEIHLPSIYEPTFSVRDFGLGMSPDMIENTYATYFKSTKDNSNDAVGGFGLGGKTPFCYTTSFSITSIYEGVKYFYTAMLGNNGVPVVSRFGEEPTDEINGVTIEFNVKERDYRRFGEEVVSQLRFFNVKPTLLNNVYDLEFENIDYRETFGNFRVSDSLDGLYIVQGEVGYPVDMTELRDKVSDENLSLFNLYTDGAMFFDIGQIEVTVSRESVQFSPLTIKSLETFIETVGPIIYKNIREKVHAFSCDWDRLSYLNESENNRVFATLAKMKFGEGGNTGDKKLKIEGGTKTQPFYINATKSRGGVVGRPNFYVSFPVPHKNKRTYAKAGDFTVKPSADTIIIVRDQTKSAIAKFYRFADQNYGKTVMLIESENTVDQKFYDFITESFGGAPFIKASELPETPKSGYQRGKPPVVYENTSTTLVDSSLSYWKKVYDEEEIETGYYLTYTTWPYIDGDTSIVKAVHDAGLFDKPIYVIKKAKADLLIDNPNFECAAKHAKAIFDDREKDMDKHDRMIERSRKAYAILDRVREARTACGPIWQHRERLAPHSEHINSLNRLTRVEKVATRYTEIVTKKIKKENRLIRDMLSQKSMNRTDDHREHAEKVISIEDSIRVRDRYPLLETVNYNTSWLDAEAKLRQAAALVAYIKMVDNVEALGVE
jgi:hypothetical protein